MAPNTKSHGERVAIVTGAAQGVGRLCSLTLARAGYRVIATDVQELAHLAQECTAQNLEMDVHVGDVSSEAFVKKFHEAVLAKYQRVDVLVNNAGISLIESAETTTSVQWQRVMDVNVLGPFLMSREFGQSMLNQRRGAIINVASVAGISGIIHRVAYNSSKHALVGMTRTLAAEWGGRGVRVNAVAPGWIKTEMDYKDQGSGAYSDDDIKNRVAMARFAQGQEVASAIEFLADSERASFINGVVLPVDGGWSGDGSWDSLRIKTR
jgi:NAD(P)-dependent dehydrogenase (short-subunit alcohol dehydrogenase family)